MACAGLRLIHNLRRVVPVLKNDCDLDLVTCLASFTDERDAWTRPEARREAEDLLEGCSKTASTDNTKSVGDLLTSLLQDRVKPLFAKSKSNTITQQGRKAISPLPGMVESADAETRSKPWKFQNVYIVSVFRWIFSHLDAGARRKEFSTVWLTLFADEHARSQLAARYPSFACSR